MISKIILLLTCLAFVWLFIKSLKHIKRKIYLLKDSIKRKKRKKAFKKKMKELEIK